MKILLKISFVTILLTCTFTSAFTQTADFSDMVIASRGGANVTLRDVDSFMQRVPEKDRANVMNSAKRIEELLLQLLSTKQLAQQARDLKLDQDPQAQAALQLAQDELLSHLRMQTFAHDLKLPDMEPLAREDYQAHKSNYVLKGKVDVEHILIDTKSRKPEEAQQLAEDVRTQALAKTADFEALVEKYSDDPSKSSNHGLMQDATSTRYVSEFTEAAGNLHKPGEISPVITTKFGYHVLKLIKREPDKQQSFAEVHDKLVEQLKNQYIENQRKLLVDGLNSEKLDANPELVASLRSRYLPPGTQLIDTSELNRMLSKPEVDKVDASKPDAQ